MSHQPVIDGLEFARTGSELRGAWPVADFPRLRDVLRTDEGTLQGELRGVPEELGCPALRLRVDGALQLVCQRCLGALDYPLHIEVSLHLAATQAEIDADSLQAEGPERIVASREMPVRDLVEDEVLLAIPLAPRHEHCGGSAAQAPREGQSPFAGLRRMVDGRKH
ncbi:MAG TPA: DUF177 domain-containing protein [Burkholderiales bacterium]|nr:DUF177 domain-containing protein [Burkholderiales bacterium]